MGFKKVVKEIGRLNNIDPASDAERMCKVTEEVGELAQAVNKTFGRKKIKEGESVEVIKANILEEGADSIQCIISVLHGYGFTADDIINEMAEKNKAWQKVIKKKKK